MQLRLCMHEFFAGRGIFARVFNLKGAYSLAVYFIIIIIILFIIIFFLRMQCRWTSVHV